jgi:hypothetical protein
VWNIEKIFFATMGYAEIHQQKPFYDNRKNISKVDVLEIQTVSICIGASEGHKANSRKTNIDD